VYAEEAMKESFVPAYWATNPHVQTILGSIKFRLTGTHSMIDASREMIIKGVEGSRLLGYYSPQPSFHRLGLVTLIHGWEGSSESTYIKSTGEYLYERGYDIFRLNLRDHGNSHHLNEGLFHGALIDETFHAVRNIAYLSDEGPYYLVGFSLGGNFALRIALKNSFLKIPHLRHVFSISPALDPYKVTLAIDDNFRIYRHYFLGKWKRSLRKKQTAFPHLYDFKNILHKNTCMALTEAVMQYYPHFDNYRKYFNLYTLLGDALTDIDIPVTIIAAEDDPIVPVGDLFELKKNRYIQTHIHKYGGHCGFLNFFPFTCWYEEKIGHMLLERHP